MTTIATVFATVLSTPSFLDTSPITPHMGHLHAIILAIVEGLTEFLPISSTGHMIITQGILGIKSSPFVKIYLVNIQFGAILSVLVYYFRRFLNFKSFDFYIKLGIAFIPAAVLGVTLNKWIEKSLDSVPIVATSLIIGGILIIWTDRIYHSQIEEVIEPADAKKEDDDPHASAEVPIPDIKLTYLQAFIVGLFQTIAMIPGVSRSAITIIGGLTQKLRMKEAAEFSFFLAVPTISAAALYKTVKGFEEIKGGDEMQNLLLGNLIAFVVAMIAIRFFVTFISKHGMKIFGYYRIVIGILILVSLYVFHLPLEIIK